ncbi:hypothetical protein AVEN_132207-1 [Araneus ventricosus]|uniref:snRNA-activating protein complex subunit 1 n=1 Tax=Araneus ventricosus TaxID=182803 RepID=A0A4Y2IJM2_ARAVE|nr:hypothetical protein AVEN_132207-1 [Araneus ventricosus]
MMAELKYVAAGFLNDAERLLLDFIRENSMEFSIFAEVWKKHNFSLIYAGRANGKELREFTLEIFLISINFLESGSLLYQVGGTFLLYALYRNQILSPPLKIRLILNQFKTILALLDISRAENYRSLHYVISYLVENSFDFAACPKLKGPNSIRNEVYKEKDEQHPKVQESDIKYELTEIVETNVFYEIDESFTHYEKTVRSLNNPFVDMTSKHPSFKKFARQIDELLNEGKISDQDTGTSLKNSAIGSRRALLKAAAFSNPVYHYLSHDENATTSCVSDGIESAVEVPSNPPVPASAPRKKRPFRRGRRKVGRPKKLPSDRLIEVEVPPNPAKSTQEKGLSGRRRRRPRGPQFTRIRNYYAEDSADSDDLDVASTSSYLPRGDYVFSSYSDSSE